MNNNSDVRRSNTSRADILVVEDTRWGCDSDPLATGALLWVRTVVQILDPNTSDSVIKLVQILIRLD